MDQVATAQVSSSAATQQRSALVAWPIRWALRIVVTAHPLAVLMQAVFAGRFMSGDFEMLRAHFVNSQVVGALGLAETALAVVYWRPGGGRGSDETLQRHPLMHGFDEPLRHHASVSQKGGKLRKAAMARPASRATRPGRGSAIACSPLTTA